MPFPRTCLQALLFLASVIAAWIPDDGFIPEGDIVTMTQARGVLSGGRDVIKDEKIVAVLAKGEAMPLELDLSAAVTIATGGYIYSSLIDAHSHIVYNVFPLCPVTKKYDNRHQWPSGALYSRLVRRRSSTRCGPKRMAPLRSSRLRDTYTNTSRTRRCGDSIRSRSAWWTPRFFGNRRRPKSPRQVRGDLLPAS